MLSAIEHRRALAGLGRLNAWSNSAGVLWRPISALAERRAPTPTRVLDVACGGGDVLARLIRRADRRGARIEWSGCDVNATALDQCRKNVGDRVRLVQCNALVDPLPDNCDVVMCSLFLHHLDDEAARRLLERMARAARRLLLVNDLERGRLNYVLVWLASRILSRSHVVHADGPRSVANAFTLPEAAALAQAAGLENARIHRCFPARLLLAWERPEAE